jgi:glycosyltransferase involved in cell wall biosynthesis
MAQGTAVVTSSGTSTQEVAGDAGLAVDPTDVDAIAATMADLLHDDERRAKVGEAGRARAATMSWEATADAVADVYDQVTP